VKKTIILISILFTIGLIVSSVLIYRIITHDPDEGIHFSSGVMVTHETFDADNVTGIFVRDEMPKAEHDTPLVYSDEVQEKARKSVRDRSEDLGEDREIVQGCMNTVASNNGGHVTVIEQAVKGNFRFLMEKRGEIYAPAPGPNEMGVSTEPCWIFNIIWGEDDEDLGHSMVMVVSAVDFVELHRWSCL
jgi:hypothetical protein